MPKISFLKNKPSFEVPVGTNLMQSLLDAKIPVASSCHGDGVCCKCVVQVIEGLQNLSTPGKVELTLHERNHLALDRRVSCQTQIMGDVTLDTGYW